MSFKHVHEILESPLSKHLKLTAVVFAEFADLDTGECWPSIATVARRCSSDERTVQRNVKQLIELGVLRQRGYHQSGTKIYRVTVPQQMSADVSRHQQMSGGGILPGGDTHATGGGDTGVGEGVTPVSPKPSLNHQLEPSERFADFWRVYPVKKNKPAALKAWQRGKLDAQADAIITDVAKRKAKDDQWLRDDGRFIPHPATYLNGERWNDDITERRPEPVKFVRPQKDSEWLNLAKEWGVNSKNKRYDVLEREIRAAMDRGVSHETRGAA